MLPNSRRLFVRKTFAVTSMELWPASSPRAFTTEVAKIFGGTAFRSGSYKQSLHFGINDIMRSSAHMQCDRQNFWMDTLENTFCEFLRCKCVIIAWATQIWSFRNGIQITSIRHIEWSISITETKSLSRNNFSKFWQDVRGSTLFIGICETILLLSGLDTSYACQIIARYAKSSYSLSNLHTTRFSHAK